MTVGGALISRLGSARDLAHSLHDAAVIVFGVLYTGLPLGHLLLTRMLPDGSLLIFFVTLVTWAGDTGAYYVGTLIGRYRLAPRVSPRKTVEGLFGALTGATVAAVIGQLWFLQSFTVIEALVCGLLLGAAGILGDLCESALKRSVGVKDSGTLLPAHGGVLDRIDSLLFTGPLFYYYVLLVRG